IHQVNYHHGTHTTATNCPDPAARRGLSQVSFRGIMPRLLGFRANRQLSVDRGYPQKDPDLTEKGFQQAAGVEFISEPDFVAISPMTRTINTAIQALGAKLDQVPVQIW